MAIGAVLLFLSTTTEIFAYDEPDNFAPPSVIITMPATAAQPADVTSNQNGNGLALLTPPRNQN